MGSSGEELKESIKVGAMLDPILDALDVNLGNHGCGIFVCMCVGACVYVCMSACVLTFRYALKK